MPAMTQDLGFILGGLKHGMPVDQAFSMYQQLQADKAAKQQEKKAALSSLVGQGVAMGMEPGADPQQITQALSALGSSQGIGPKGMNKAFGMLGGTPEAPGLLGATGWDDEDEAGFNDPANPQSPINYMNQLIASGRFTPEGGAPDRAALRQEMQQGFGVTPEEAPGFNIALDRAYDRMMNTAPAEQITPELFEEYQAKINGAPTPDGATGGGAGQTALGYGLLGASAATAARTAGSLGKRVLPEASKLGRLSSYLSKTPTVRSLAMKAGRPALSSLASRMPAAVASGAGAASGALGAYGVGSLYNQIEGTTDTGGIPVLGGIQDRMTPETPTGIAMQGASQGLVPLLAQGASNIDRYLVNPISSLFD